MKKLFLKIKNQIKKILIFPNVIFLSIIFIISILFIGLASILQENEPFISSVLSNISAGMISGIVLYILANIKTSFKYKNEYYLNKLENIKKAIKNFGEIKNKISLIKTQDNQKFIEEALECTFVALYINTIIEDIGEKDNKIQLYNHIKNNYNYDSKLKQKEIDKINEYIKNNTQDIDYKKTIRKYISTYYHDLRVLSLRISEEIRCIKDKNKLLEKSFF